jgi:hypothetical protein
MASEAPHGGLGLRHVSEHQGRLEHGGQAAKGVLLGCEAEEAEAKQPTSQQQFVVVLKIRR